MNEMINGITNEEEVMDIGTFDEGTVDNDMFDESTDLTEVCSESDEKSRVNLGAIACGMAAGVVATLVVSKAMPKVKEFFKKRKAKSDESKEADDIIDVDCDFDER